MFIEIEGLQPEPLQLRHVYQAADLRFERKDASLEAPVSTDITLTHKNRELDIEGTVETRLRQQCARCLRQCIRDLSTHFRVSYMPHSTAVREDDEIELKDRDMNVGFYDGIRLDVDLLVLEQIELAMPMKFLCSDGCKGLCPGCGANLNEGLCRCKEEPKDPRLSALLEFRKKMHD